MKITIDISDFYLEEEDIERGLKQYIIREAVSAIQKSIHERIEKQIILQVKETVEKTMYTKITKSIGEVIKTAAFPKRSNSREMGTIEDYIKDCLAYTGGWDNFVSQIKKIAEAHSKEIKERYDLMFASQIVAKLGDNGLLNSDAARLLLKNNDSKKE